jgi:hypothetical protein
VGWRPDSLWHTGKIQAQRCEAITPAKSVTAWDDPVRKDSVIEHVRNLVAFIGELILDVEGVCEGKHQDDGSYDADRFHSTQKECDRRSCCYDGNPGPDRA